MLARTWALARPRRRRARRGDRRSSLRPCPSGDYLFVPNAAHPVAEKVAVEGEGKPDAAGGIYYVDVRLKKARWLERLVPFLRPDGASIVPAHAVTAPGQSFEDRIAKARVEMSRSEEIAAAVALQAAGKNVDAAPRGALVESVAIDVPAANTLRNGDVIVEAGGQAVRTPDALRRAVGRRGAGRPGPPASAPRGQAARAHGAHRGGAGRREARAIIGVRVSQDARIELPVDVEDRPR